MNPSKELIFGTVTFDELLDAMRGDMDTHRMEVPFGKYGLGKLDLNEEAYRTAEEHGHARFYVAFIGRKPVAYISLIASNLLHHKTVMSAFSDAYYVVPEYRTSGIFGKLLAHVEQDCKALGIRFINLGYNTQHKEASPDFLLSTGYRVSDVIYTKEV